MRLAIWLLCAGCTVEHSYMTSGGTPPGPPPDAPPGTPPDGPLPPPPGCNDPTYSIETGATLTYVIGVDAGYYAYYGAGGAWHFEWTCNTDLSALGCEFTGTIVAPGGGDATCFRCEANDAMIESSDGTNATYQFDTLTSTGIDGIEFTATPGAPIEIDLQINGLYQNDYVFIPMGGAALEPTCMPAQIAPTSP